MQYPIKFWNSIVTRFGIFFIGLLMLSIFISGYLVYKNSSRVILNYNQDRLKHTSELASKSFYALLNQVRNDIALISESPVVNAYINSPTSGEKANLEKLFFNTLLYKPDYFQIRIISTEDYGKEEIRFDKYFGRISHTLPFELQYKDDKNYFKEATVLGKNEFFISEINLNEEYGVVEKPYTPTLRASSPLFTENGKMRGILVINVSLIRLYRELDKISESGINISIVDSLNQYLYSLDKEKCFNLQLGHNNSFRSEFGREIDSLAGSENTQVLRDVQKNQYMYLLNDMSYYFNKNRLYLITTISEEKILSNILTVRNQSVSYLAFICGAALVIFILFTSIYKNRITQITKTIISYNENTKPKELKIPSNSRDELGVLAKTFNLMQEKINNQMRDLNMALKKEKEAIREKDDFLQNMSHELRTPLNAIIGLTQVLQKNKPNKNQVPVIESIIRSADNLAGLMYDILDIQNLKEGRVHIQAEPTDISKILYDIYASYQFEAIKKKLKLTLEIQNELKNQFYLTDRKRLGQVITNLLVNAIKYTHEGFVKVKAKIEYHDNLNLVIQIEDSGIGIDPHNKDKIKERFFQENIEDLGNQEGFGLGLSIVKHLTDLFGGTLNVESQKGVGSEFIFSIPIIKVEKPIKQNIIPDENPLPELSATYRLVHLEDDESSRHLISHLISYPNIKLHSFGSFEKLHSFLLKEPVNLILSDVMLGNENIKSGLKNIKDTYQVPVIVLSAFEKDKVEDITPYFLQKPFDHLLLKNLIFVILGRNEYEYPDLESIYKNYDNTKSSISRYLELLDREFALYKERIINAIDTRDQKEWDAIIHKMVAHIHSMKLTQFAELLAVDVRNIEPGMELKIKNYIAYFQTVFRVEKFRLSQ